MDTSEILAEHDRDIRSKPFTNDPIFKFEWDGPVFRFSGPSTAPPWNGVLYSRLTAQDAEEAIARQIQYFQSIGHGFEWKLYDYDTPPDLTARLQAAGLVPQDEEGFAVRDLETAMGDFEPPPDVIIRSLTEDEYNLIIRLNIAVYGAADHAADLIADLRQEHAHAPETLSVYGAFADDILVSAGWVRLHAPSRFASLWGGATRAEWRGKGIYSALVSIRAQEARDKGFRWLTVDCSPSSRPILERRGFRVLCTTTPWAWTMQNQSDHR